MGESVLFIPLRSRISLHFALVSLPMGHECRPFGKSRAKLAAPEAETMSPIETHNEVVNRTDTR